MDAARLLITGTGALASLFAARLAASGVHVAMLGSWPEGLAALRTAGVRILSPNGKENAYPVEIIDRSVPSEPFNFALVLVKSWQTERTARELAGYLSDGGVALTLQNGHGNLEKLAAVLGEDRVALGVTTTGATLVGPGLVRPGGAGYLAVGAHPRIPPLVELLAGGGFDARETQDADSLVWSKLVINAAINPLTAILDIPNGELLTRPAARALMAKLALEAAAVAHARGTVLTFADPVEAAEEVARRTAQNHSSMMQDVRRGAPTEIDAICGAIVREGLRLGVPTPENEAALRMVQEAVRAAVSARASGTVLH